MALMWLILKFYTILEDFFLLNSILYRDDVIITLKFHWSDVKILMSVWYRKPTWSPVLFTIYQLRLIDIEGDLTRVSLQYQNSPWGTFHFIKLCCFPLEGSNYNILRFFFFYTLNDQLILCFQKKNCCVCHECAFEFTDWLIRLVH